MAELGVHPANPTPYVGFIMPMPAHPGCYRFDPLDFFNLPRIEGDDLPSFLYSDNPFTRGAVPSLMAGLPDAGGDLYPSLHPEATHCGKGVQPFPPRQVPPQGGRARGFLGGAS